MKMRATHWQLMRDRLTFDEVPKLMGIVNVTPDSFSDGGSFIEPSHAVEHALQLADDGADILDIGGESTRPYSTPVPAEEELRRVLPVIKELARQTNVPLSIDTSKADVAERALDAGAQIINDVTGLEGDPLMVSVARRSHAGVCAMHMQGTPQTMQENPQYHCVVAEISDYLQTRLERLQESGVEVDRICLDPGIGFGKEHRHNLQLLQASAEFHKLGQPLLVGHSRKGFIAHVLQDKTTDRTPATIGVSLALATHGIQILRVHDILPTRQALLLFQAAGGLGGTAESK